MKKRNLLYIIVLILFFMSGCNNNDVVSNGEKIDTSKMLHKHCTREVTTDDDSEAELSYDIYYTDDNLNLLKSYEKIKSSKSDTLDEYEEAYKKVDEHYVDLQYYDIKMERKKDYLTHEIVINYDKINTNQLLDIEGTEYSIIEDGKAKVDKWLELSKKVGIKCHIVDEEE